MKIQWIMTLSIKTVRRFIFVALMLVVFTNIAVWVKEYWRPVVGVIWGISAAIVAIVCRAKTAKIDKANAKYYLWLAIPIILTLIPLIIKVVDIFQSPSEVEPKTTWDLLWELIPFLISFVIPVVLLGFAYWGLEGYLEPSAGPTPPKTKKGKTPEEVTPDASADPETKNPSEE